METHLAGEFSNPDGLAESGVEVLDVSYESLCVSTIPVESHKVNLKNYLMDRQYSLPHGLNRPTVHPLHDEMNSFNQGFPDEPEVTAGVPSLYPLLTRGCIYCHHMPTTVLGERLA